MSGEKKMIWVGKSSKCNRRQVDGVKWYTDKYKQAEEEWEKAKNSHKKENQGVVIVVFKLKECV